MIVEYEYIHFIEVEKKPKTKVFECRNKKTNYLLGWVKWYAQWRQYAFFPDADVLFSNGCLRDIDDFICQLKEERKELK